MVILCLFCQVDVMRNLNNGIYSIFKCGADLQQPSAEFLCRSLDGPLPSLANHRSPVRHPRRLAAGYYGAAGANHLITRINDILFPPDPTSGSVRLSHTSSPTDRFALEPSSAPLTHLPSNSRLFVRPPCPRPRGCHSADRPRSPEAVLADDAPGPKYYTRSIYTQAELDAAHQIMLQSAEFGLVVNK